MEITGQPVTYGRSTLKTFLIFSNNFQKAVPPKEEI